MSAAEAADHAAEKVGGLVGRKIGPLPAGVWALAILGGVGVAVMVRRSAQETELVDAADTIAEEAPADAGWDQADPGGTQPTTGGPATPTPGDGSYPEAPPSLVERHAQAARKATTNAAWRTHAVAAMAALGFDRERVNRIIGDHLNGRQLTVGESTTLAAVLSWCGPPPVPPVRKAPPGHKKPVPHHPVPSTKDDGKAHK